MSEGIPVLEVIEGTMNGSKYLSLLKRRLLRNLKTLRPESAEDENCEQLIFQQNGLTSHN